MSWMGATAPGRHPPASHVLLHRMVVRTTHWPTLLGMHSMYVVVLAHRSTAHLLAHPRMLLVVMGEMRMAGMLLLMMVLLLLMLLVLLARVRTKSLRIVRSTTASSPRTAMRRGDPARSSATGSGTSAP